LSIEEANVDAFAAAFDAVARRHLAPEQLDAVIWSDGELGAEEFTLDLARVLRWAGPWGQMFPEPVFDGEFEVERWRVVGETHLRLHLRRAGRVEPIEAIGFDAFRGTPPPRRIHTAFQLDIDEWSGTPKLRLLLRHLCDAG
jgi:single-stranded-DNA-specific exonuclease